MKNVEHVTNAFLARIKVRSNEEVGVYLVDEVDDLLLIFFKLQVVVLRKRDGWKAN